MTPQTISRAFALCAATYRERFQIPSDPDEARFMVEVWADLLRDVPDRLGFAAFERHCTSEKHAPTPADIRESAGASLTLPTPGEAWAEVWEAARRHGYQNGTVPDMSHPEITAAARATPWFRICLSNTESELSFAQRDFMKIYEGLCSRTERELVKAQIEGRAPSGLLPQIKTIEAAISEEATE